MTCACPPPPPYACLLTVKGYLECKGQSHHGKVVEDHMVWVWNGMEKSCQNGTQTEQAQDHHIDEQQAYSHIQVTWFDVTWMDANKSMSNYIIMLAGFPPLVPAVLHVLSEKVFHIFIEWSKPSQGGWGEFVPCMSVHNAGWWTDWHTTVSWSPVINTNWVMS